jgi:hypothetical protein
MYLINHELNFEFKTFQIWQLGPSFILNLKQNIGNISFLVGSSNEAKHY